MNRPRIDEEVKFVGHAASLVFSGRKQILAMLEKLSGAPLGSCAAD